MSEQVDPNRLAPEICRLSRHELGDMVAWYVLDEKSRRVGLWLIPAEMESAVVSRRATLESRAVANFLRGTGAASLRAWSVDSLVQVSLRDEDNSVGRGQGRSLRRGPATQALQLVGQFVETEGSALSIRTVLESRQLRVEHRLSHVGEDPFLRVGVNVSNRLDRSVDVDLVTSFSLGGISPFARGDAHRRLQLHRFRSAWAGEGRHVVDSIEHLHLDRTWAGFNPVCERFGSVGSRPVTTFFPQALVEDTAVGVFWGASLACHGSWQIELFREDDLLNLSGGPADREFGHWSKRLAPGESFSPLPAVVTVCRGTLDVACARLTAAQLTATRSQPAVERDLPVCFNDFCTVWGKPTHDRTLALVDRLKGTGVTYYVIDAGWSAADGDNWTTVGDWEVDARRFPQGLAPIANAIRHAGMVPGIWFEWEVCQRPSRVFDAHADLMLHRDGKPLTVGGRRFWDMRNPLAREQIDARMMAFLHELGFGYLKIDYNENIGFGVDGPDSPGENLRQHIEATYHYVRRLRQSLPELVIENCASGGHRLEPEMQSICAMGSFSDAHETNAIPIVAANLHRLILPSQSLVWAVLREDDEPARTVYSLASTFLGRMCLSGDIDRLNDPQWKTTLRAIELYSRCREIIRVGTTHRFGPEVGSYEHPLGWQAVRRDDPSGHTSLVVVHRFDASAGDELHTPLNHGAWRVIDELRTPDSDIRLAGGQLVFRSRHPLDAAVVLLERVK